METTGVNLNVCICILWTLSLLALEAARGVTRATFSLARVERHRPLPPPLVEGTLMPAVKARLVPGVLVRLVQAVP